MIPSNVQKCPVKACLCKLLSVKEKSHIVYSEGENRAGFRKEGVREVEDEERHVNTRL